MKRLLVSVIVLLCLISVFSLKSLEIEDGAQTVLAERNHKYPIHRHERTKYDYSVRRHDSWRDYDSWQHKGRGEYAYGSKRGKRHYLVQNKARNQWWHYLILPIGAYVVGRIIQRRQQYQQLQGQWVQQWNQAFPPNHYEMAVLSQLAYGNPLNQQQRLLRLQAIAQMPGRGNIVQQMARFQWHQGTPYWYAVSDPQAGTLYVIFRGTVPTDAYDLANDAQIAGGWTPNRVHAGLQYAVGLQQQGNFAGNSITIMGHSLGGTIAEAVADRMGGGVNAVSFNPGTSPLQTFQNPSQRIIAYHIRGDPISQWSTRGFKRIIRVNGGGINPFFYHTIQRYIEL